MRTSLLMLVTLLGSFANAAVETIYQPITYDCDGSDTTFTFSWDIDSTSEIVVTLVTESTGATTELALNSDYTVTATNDDFRSGPGGTVTTTETYSDAYQIVLSRSLSHTQETAYNNSGALRPSMVRNSVDRLTMMVQDLQEQINRCLRLPIESHDQDANVPGTAERYIIIDANGDADSTAASGVIDTDLALWADVTPSSFFLTLPVAATQAALNVLLGLGTTDSPQFTAVNIGDASDTTIARSGAGDITVEGNAVYRAGGTDVPVTDGGTGASSLTDGGVLLGSGTGAITPMAVLADGEIIIGDGATDPTTMTLHASYRDIIDGTTTTLSNLRTIRDQLGRPWVNVKADYGAAGDGVTDDTSAIQNAEGAADDNGGVLYFPAGTYAVDSLTVSSNVALAFDYGAKLSVNTGETVTIYSPSSILNGYAMSDIFDYSGTGRIAWSIPGTVYAEWWADGRTDFATTPSVDMGAIINYALDSLKATGGGATGSGVVHLKTGRYGIETPINIKSGHRGTILEGEGMFDRGTVLYSLITNSADDVLRVTGTTADNGETGTHAITIRDLYVDGCGTEVYGIELYGMYNGCGLQHVTIKECGGGGLYVNTAYPCVFEDVHCVSNTGNGVTQVGNVGNLWLGGHWGTNTGDGFNGTGLTASGVTIEYNTGDGIDVAGESGSTYLVGCTFESDMIEVGHADSNYLQFTAVGCSLDQITFVANVQQYLLDGCQLQTDQAIIVSDQDSVFGIQRGTWFRPLMSGGNGYGQFDIGTEPNQVNLIKNGTFENETAGSAGENGGTIDGWYLSDPANADGDFTIVADNHGGPGSYCLDVNCTSYTSGDGLRAYNDYNPIDVVAGRVYTLAFSVKATDLADGDNAYVRLDNAGTTVANVYALGDCNDTWHRRVVQWVATDDGYMNVSFGLKEVAALRIDSVTMVEGPEPLVCPATTVENLNSIGDVNTTGSYMVNGQVEHYNVRSYGATGDGVTDDTSAIQAALDAAVADGGGVVYFPPGTYIVSKALYVDGSGVTLKGDDPNTTIIDGYDTAALDVSGHAPGGSGVYGLVYWDDAGGVLDGGALEGLTLRCCPTDPSTVMQKGVFVGDVNDMRVENCIFYGSYWECLYINYDSTSAAGRMRVINNTFYGNGGTGGSLCNWNMTASNSIRAIITGNIFERADTIGLMVAGSGFLVDGNIFRQCEQTSIYVGEGDPFAAPAGVVSNNLVIQPGYGGAYATATAVRIVGNDKDSSSVLVEGNAIYDMQSGSGFYASGSVTMTNNLVHGRGNAAAEYPFYVAYPANIADCTCVQYFIGNTVADTNEALKWHFTLITQANASQENNTIYSIGNYWGDIDSGWYSVYLGNGATNDNLHICGDICMGKVVGQKGAMASEISIFGRPLYVSNVTTYDNDMYVDRFWTIDANVAGEVFIDSNGVGIGMAPTKPLDITSGTAQMYFQDSSQDNLYVSGVNATLILNALGSNYPGIFLKKDGTSYGGIGLDGSDLQYKNSAGKGLRIDGTSGLLTADYSMAAKNGSTSAGYLDLYEDSDDGSSKFRLISGALSGDVTATVTGVTGTGSLVQHTSPTIDTGLTLQGGNGTKAYVRCDEADGGVFVRWDPNATSSDIRNWAAGPYYNAYDLWELRYSSAKGGDPLSSGAMAIGVKGLTGYVGVATTDPNTALDVEGTVTANSLIVDHGAIVKDGNLLLNTTTDCGNGGGVMVFGVVDANSVTCGADTAGLYADDSAGSAEMYALDEEDNATKISPHNEDGEWEFFSRNKRTGREVRINMEAFVKDYDRRFGTSFFTESEPLDPNEYKEQ